MKIRAYKNENPLEELIDVLKKASRKGCDSVEIRLGFDEINKLLKELQWALSMDTADTPQTDCDKCIWSVCNYNKVEWDADTPQTEPMKTADYCDICKQDMCELCIADVSNPYCVPSHYEIKQTEPIADTPQTDVYDYKGNGKWERSE